MKKIAVYSLMAALIGGSIGAAPKMISYGAERTNPAVSEISADRAKEIALADAGLKENQVTILKNKLDYDDGITGYEVEFTYNSSKYDYEIDAVSGSIMEYSKKLIGRYSVGTSTITLNQAKETALKAVGKASKDVTFTKEKSSYDDGRQEYDIEFIAADIKYEFEILADGTVYEYSYQRILGGFSTGSQITLEEAKNIAFKHAGLNSGQVTYLKTDTDSDDGRLEYEVEFYYNGIEYEYTIDASSGTILEFDRD